MEIRRKGDRVTEIKKILEKGRYKDKIQEEVTRLKYFWKDVNRFI